VNQTPGLYAGPGVYSGPGFYLKFYGIYSRVLGHNSTNTVISTGQWLSTSFCEIYLFADLERIVMVLLYQYI